LNHHFHRPVTDTGKKQDHKQMNHQAGHSPYKCRHQIGYKGNYDMSLSVKSEAGRKKTCPNKKYTAQFHGSKNRCFQNISGKHIETDHDKKQKRKQGRKPVGRFIQIFINRTDQLLKKNFLIVEKISKNIDRNVINEKSSCFQSNLFSNICGK
jgi:hypothetical protein